MWGLFIGLAIGVLQVLALTILGKMIIGERASARLIGIFLLIAKIAAIVLILYLISTISLTHVIFTACGMLAGVIAALVFVYMKRKRGNDRPLGKGR